MRDGAAIYRKAFTEGLKPDADLTVSEWSDAYRMLSNKASAEPGPWRTDRTPYLKEIMDAMSANSAVQRVVFMAGAQLGKTEAINNIVGYMIAHAPGPALFVQPTIEMAKRLSKQRLDSLIYETPALSGLVAPPRSRDGDNTMFSKSFPGGILLLTGANSATGLRSAPCRWVLLDEVDAFPSDVDGEGDPCALAERMASTFSRREIILTSTPTIKDMSRIERSMRRRTSGDILCRVRTAGICSGCSGRICNGVRAIRALRLMCARSAGRTYQSTSRARCCVRVSGERKR